MNGPSPTPQKAANKSQESSGDTLYAARKKLYVRAVAGIFANWRWLLVWLTQLLYYGLPWLSWNDRQAVLFHLTERKFYIFRLGVLAAGCLLPRAVADHLGLRAVLLHRDRRSRLWCGYACPQTVLHRDLHVDRAEDRR